MYEDEIAATFVLSLLLGAFICGLVSAAAWSRKGGNGGFFIGFFLGPLGVLYTLLSQPKGTSLAVGVRERECPHCKSMIRRDAHVCPHCQRESRAWTFHEGQWWVQDDAGNWFWLREGTASPEWVKAGSGSISRAARSLTGQRQEPPTTPWIQTSLGMESGPRMWRHGCL